MPKVTFLMDGDESSGDFESGTRLLHAAQKLEVPIISTCGGQPSCTDCRVKVLQGMENLSKPEYAEVSLIGSVSHITQERLSCQAKVRGDVCVQPLRLRRR